MKAEEIRRIAYDNVLDAHSGKADAADIEREIIRLSKLHGKNSDALWSDYAASERKKEDDRRDKIGRQANQGSFFGVDDDVLRDGVWRLGEGLRVRIADAGLPDVMQHEAIDATKFAEHAEARARSSRANAELISALVKKPGATVWDITR